jgi:hypothetical protein
MRGSRHAKWRGSRQLPGIFARPGDLLAMDEFTGALRAPQSTRRSFDDAADMKATSMDKTDPELMLRRAFGRWDNEGGASTAGPQQDVHGGEGELPVPPLTNAELVQLQVRVIALENLVMALLAGATDEQRLLARDMAASIQPREGFTHHPLTIHAGARMDHMLGRAALFGSGEAGEAPGS